MRGPDETPVRAPKALVLILDFLYKVMLSNVHIILNVVFEQNILYFLTIISNFVILSLQILAFMIKKNFQLK